MKYGLGISLIVVFCLVLPLHAEIYKWTDEQGRVHYSDKPPSEATPQYQLHTPASDGNTLKQQSATESERRARQKKLSDSLAADRREKEQADAKRQEQQARREHNCKLAQKDLNILLKTNRIYDYDQQGNKIYYDEVQRQQFIAERRAVVRKWCE